MWGLRSEHCLKKLGRFITAELAEGARVLGPFQFTGFFVTPLRAASDDNLSFKYMRKIDSQKTLSV